MRFVKAGLRRGCEEVFPALRDPDAGGAHRALLCAHPLPSSPSARSALGVAAPVPLWFCRGPGTWLGQGLEPRDGAWRWVWSGRWGGWAGWVLRWSSRLTEGQGGASRGAEPSSGAACVLAGAPFSLISAQAITRQRTLLPLCCPQPFVVLAPSLSFRLNH